MLFTTTYSSFVTMVYTPSPTTDSIFNTSSSPETVRMQSPTETSEAYTRGRGVPQTPDGRIWFGVIFKSRLLTVVKCTNTALSMLAPWGMKMTSENIVSCREFAAKTRSPTWTNDKALDSPDSRSTVSDPAKHDLRDSTGEAVST